MADIPKNFRMPALLYQLDTEKNIIKLIIRKKG